jgi:nucleotide-binding universal stress UspA family protein
MYYRQVKKYIDVFGEENVLVLVMEEFVKDNHDAVTAAGVSDVRSRVLTGDVTDEILQYVKDNNANLIVMGTHGYKGLERVMFGSVADKVVKTACCPVMTINPYREDCETNADN